MHLKASLQVVSSVSLLLLSLYGLHPAHAYAVGGNNVQARQDAQNHWVASWTSMPQLVEPDNLPPSPFKQSNSIFKNATLRQTHRLTLVPSSSPSSPSRLRIQISNTFGTSDLPITSASLALPLANKAGARDIQPDSIHAITFGGGKSGVTVARGAVVYSDAIEGFGFAGTGADEKMGRDVTLSLYLEKGQAGTSITGHPGSRTTSWMVAGEKVNASGSAWQGAASTKHWYFSSGIEAWVPKSYGGMFILGDSITDGRGSTDDSNNRWPDLLHTRLHALNTTPLSIANQAAGGNRILADGLGPSLLSRYTRDALTQPGCFDSGYILIFEGVNDMGSASTDASTQTRIGDQLIAAYTKIANDAHKNSAGGGSSRIPVFVATITPFSAPGGSGQQPYSDPRREATRQRVNGWMRANANHGGTGGSAALFEAVVDFDKAVRDAANADRLDGRYNGGDWLHPNVAGYQAMADAFPVEVFEKFKRG